MAATVETYLLSDAKRDALQERRVECVRRSKTFQMRVETVVKTKLHIEAGKITVEQEMAQQAEQFMHELSTSICTELDSIRGQVLDGSITVAQGLASYRERTEISAWPTVVLEAKPGESVEDLAQRLEELGYAVCANDYAEDEDKALKFGALGMVHAHVPPDVELIKPLADVDGVEGVFDGDRALVPPPLKPAAVRDAYTNPVSMVLPDPDELPKDCPRELGKDAVICVIDSGVDKDHPDLAGRVVAERDFTGEGDTADHLGHGTHCAGIAAGAGTASDGRFAGVAPHAQILSARIFDKDGSATTSRLLVAIRWAVESGAHVINLSVGQEEGPADGDSLVARACNKAAQAGLVVCVSAGNEGPEPNTITTPGDAAEALSVAAMDSDRAIADFSGRGPTDAPDRTGPKPDVAAPGVDVVSCLSSKSDWAAVPDQPQYAAASGTSMAAPHAAGAAAILVSMLKAQGRADSMGAQVRDALVQTAQKLPRTPGEAQGMGLIDVAEAAAALNAATAVTSQPGRVTITLGQREEGPVTLKAETFQRHFACLGSSGSGKTVACKVICEEFIRQGVPVIAIDPQGDIARMGERAGEATVAKKGVPVEILHQYDQMADVVIWTPASSKGIPLCVNPLNFDFESDDTEVVVHSLSAMADSICTLMGYDLDKDDGNSAQSFLYMVFEHIYNTGRDVDSFTGLADAIGDLPEPIMKRASNIISEREIRTLTRKMLNLTIGAKGLMFENGVPLDVDTLLGRNDDSGRARLSVIYLNSLSSQEEKDFFVCQIAERLYHWMLRNPGDQKGLQAVFYIDEIAKFIPPVRKPACKDALMMLFRQARKYGVGCVIATQSPGDIDYTALDQFATWNLGQMKTRQTRAKVIDFLQALDPEKAESIGGRLAGLQKGNFIILSADEFEEPVPYKVRWLVTKHGSPLSDDDVAKRVTSEMRKRFAVPAQAAKMERGAKAETPALSDEEVEQYSAMVARLLDEVGHALPDDELLEGLEPRLTDAQTEYLLRKMADKDMVRLHRFYGLPGQAVAPPAPEPAEEPQLIAASVEPDQAVAEAPGEPEPEPEEPSEQERVVELLLDEKRCMTTAEIGDALDAGSPKVLRLMSALVAKNLVMKDRMGSSNVYWHADYDLRPQDGQAEALIVAALKISERDARAAAEETLAGFFSKSEQITETEFRHLPLWQVEVKVEETSGLIFKTKTEATATIYLHAADGRICCYDPSNGFALSDVADGSPTRIRDLDDVCTFEEKMPGEIELDPDALDGLMEEDAVLKLVERKYLATAQRVKLVLLPHWHFRIESTDGTKSREVLLDGVTGKALTL